MEKVIELDVTIPKQYYMSVEDFYNSLVSICKKDYPECFNEIDFYDYVSNNIDVLIRDVFELKDDVEISDSEVDYVFNLFNEYFNALFSK